ncbi:hypothetical protein [Thiocapsa sp.]|uniref:hypothetical protein n=1 Tax=Thiocapsa sp. TaxID=2024551 RepID=UPI003593E17A
MTPDNPTMRRCRKDITPWSGLDRVTEAAPIAAFPAKGSNPNGTNLSENLRKNSLS